MPGPELIRHFRFDNLKCSILKSPIPSRISFAKNLLHFLAFTLTLPFYPITFTASYILPFTFYLFTFYFLHLRMKTLLTTLTLCISLSAFAQQPTRILCGNELLRGMAETHFPEWQRAVDAVFLEAKNAPVRRNDEPLEIKVVVHVVWKETAENLHDSIILNQIKVLNEDYNRQNPDTSNVRPVFENNAKSPNIRFVLQDIVRVQTNRVFEVDLFGGMLIPEVKHSEDGGSDAWDTESYLNIWITKIQPLVIFGQEVGQLLGFAFPPSGLSHWPDGSTAPDPSEEGVVLDYRVVGRNNPNFIEKPDGSGDQLIVRGRSATHEVGHFLGLRHIWGDGDLLGENDCQQSDGIDDTPFASTSSNFSCDHASNTCSDIDVFYNEDVPDMIENFMDYSSEECLNMFTIGQANLMRNVLQGPRSGLIEQSSSTKPVLKNLPFEVSPNPFTNNVRIKLHESISSDAAIILSDLNGKLTQFNLKQEDVNALPSIGISLEGFASGIYIIEIRTNDSVGAQKIVKM